jgi:hypothetical protein
MKWDVSNFGPFTFNTDVIWVYVVGADGHVSSWLGNLNVVGSPLICCYLLAKF